jgi:hypothetical protein
MFYKFPYNIEGTLHDACECMPLLDRAYQRVAKRTIWPGPQVEMVLELKGCVYFKRS